MGKSFLLNDALTSYVEATWLREPSVLRDLRAETAKMEEAGMQIAADQGQFMAMMAQLTGARRCLEVGVFTGYSSTAVALALPDEGKITALDISEEFTSKARAAWEKAGVSGKIELILGPAIESLDALIEKNGAGTFDMAFIDADKPNYVAYYERVVTLLKKGGLLLADNVLWDGKVADLEVLDEQTLAIRQFNEHVHRDERVDICLVPIGDGVTMARKR